MNPGYIYILQNPSLSETHLKIGRTERDPEERAAEISRGTGVPTPFKVVWWSESIDCHLAETLLHEELDETRTNSSREFFDLELEEAIPLAKRAIRRSGGRTGGVSYLLRRSCRAAFHGVIRPLRRLPIQIILLLAILVWWIVRNVLLLSWRILTWLLQPLFPRTSKSTRTRKNTKDRSTRRVEEVAHHNAFYLKEVCGALLWFGLSYVLLSESGADRLREIVSHSFFESFSLEGIAKLFH